MEYEIDIDLNVFLPCYRHLVKFPEVDIDFVYGSRDSGKSRNTAQILVKRCLEEKYFRHILARKTYNTILDSQWQLIKDVVEDWGLGDLFEFNKNPLAINCINGNRFIGRGFDDPQKIKSIQNPSGAWVEEGNQLSREDWTVLITSLRSNHGKTKVDFTFNPEADGDFREFWLYKDYFSHTKELSFSHTKMVEVGTEKVPIKYRATHTTYEQNKYCSPIRKAIYEDLKHTSPYHYRIYAQGLWGNRENKAPFVLTFRREAKDGRPSHLGKTSYNPELPLYLSFDFNRNPMCTSVVQWDGEKKVDWIEVIKLPNSNIWQVCDLIKAKYPGALFIVNGDYSGNNTSALVKENDLNNYYKVIRDVLDLTTGQVQIEPNPRIEKNQVLVNWCFHHLDITINPETCGPFIFDIEFGEMLSDGTLKKGDREDPAQQLDALDTGRYFFNKNFKKIVPV